MAKEYKRIVRVIEYAGEAEWIAQTLERSIQGTLACGRGSITCVTIGEAQEIPCFNNRELKDLPEGTNG
jgi:diaminopimelate epimerase